MKITSIRIQQKFSKGDVVALATITIDRYLTICNIKVIRDSNSKLIDVPAYTDEYGDVHAADEIIDDLRKAVKIAYSNYMAEHDLHDLINKRW